MFNTACKYQLTSAECERSFSVMTIDRFNVVAMDFCRQEKVNYSHDTNLFFAYP